MIFGTLYPVYNVSTETRQIPARIRQDSKKSCNKQTPHFTICLLLFTFYLLTARGKGKKIDKRNESQLSQSYLHTVIVLRPLSKTLQYI